MENLLIKKRDASRPLKLAIMCCDDPLHFYLIHQLKQHFPISGVIIEPNNKQMGWLWKKRKYKLWGYRFYHSKRRRLSGHTRFRKKYFQVDLDLKTVNFPIKYVSNVNEGSTVEFLNAVNPDLTICAGTMYLGKKIRSAGNCLINLHGGILPEYKGNQCIFFALYEKNYEKVGATIHLVAKKLDGGSVISKVKPIILPADNDEALYCKSLKLCIIKLIEIINNYNAGKEIITINQIPVESKTYSHCDRGLLVEIKYNIDRFIKILSNWDFKSFRNKA